MGILPSPAVYGIKRAVRKKKEKVFFHFCFPRDSPFILAPMSRSQLPSVKCVYAVDRRYEYDRRV
jgi:hypothetical protein